MWSSHHNTTEPSLIHLPVRLRKVAASLAAVAVVSAGLATPLSAQALSGVLYVTGGMVPGTSVARAYCPRGYIVSGGGGLTTSGQPAALQQSFPISDTSGVFAWGKNAIGWQVAADDWSDVQAFVVCLAP